MSEPRQFSFGSAVLGFSSRPDRAYLAAALADGTVRLIPRSGSAVAQTVEAHQAPIRGIVYHPQRACFLMAGEDGRICAIGFAGATSEVPRLGTKWIENLAVDTAGG